jgi:hypothetical protein
MPAARSRGCEGPREAAPRAEGSGPARSGAGEGRLTVAASVRIEDDAFSDRRYDRLATIAGLADADHARGKMAVLWRQCTIERRYQLDREDVVAVLGPRGVDALVTARLGEVVGDQVRIRGTKGRIEWRDKLRKNGLKGGRPKKKSGNQLVSESQTNVEPTDPEQLNPPAPAPAPAPALPETTAPLVAAPGGQSTLAIQMQATPLPAPRSKKQPTGDHQRVIDAFQTRYVQAYGCGATWGPAQGNMVRLLLGKQPADEVIRRIDNLFDAPPHFLAGSAVDLSTLVQHFDKLVTRAGPRGSAERAPEPPRKIPTLA